MHLDRRLATPEPGPGKQCQAQIDGRRIQRIQAPVQIDAHRVAGVQPARSCNQRLREIGIDAPVARLVGIGQRRTRHTAANTHVVQLAAHRAQAGLDVAQALAIGELGEGHRQILIPAGEVLCVVVPTITSDALVKFLVGQMLDQLRKYGAARVHPALLPLPPPLPSSVSGLNEFKSFPATKPLIPLPVSREGVPSIVEG